MPENVRGVGHAEVHPKWSWVGHTVVVSHGGVGQAGVGWPCMDGVGVDFEGTLSVDMRPCGYFIFSCKIGWEAGWRFWLCCLVDLVAV